MHRGTIKGSDLSFQIVSQKPWLNIKPESSWWGNHNDNKRYVVGIK